MNNILIFDHVSLNTHVSYFVVASERLQSYGRRLYRWLKNFIIFYLFYICCQTVFFVANMFLFCSIMVHCIFPFKTRIFLLFFDRIFRYFWYMKLTSTSFSNIRDSDRHWLYLVILFCISDDRKKDICEIKCCQKALVTSNVFWCWMTMLCMRVYKIEKFSIDKNRMCVCCCFPLFQVIIHEERLESLNLIEQNKKKRIWRVNCE